MSDKIRLLVADGASGNFLKRVKANAASAPFDITAPDSADLDALLALAPGAEAILCYKAALPASVIHAAGKLRYIQKHGLNCKNIDADAARERGGPRRHAVAHAERHGGRAGLDPHALLRAQDDFGPEGGRGGRLPRDGAYAGRHQPVEHPPNWPEIEGVAELFGQSVGIIGLGDIGMDIARRCLAFGMEIFYYQRTRHTADVEAEYQARYLGFDDLLARVDYLVLVLPHTEESEGMIGAGELARMKKTAALINVGRGALVDEAALAVAPPGG